MEYKHAFLVVILLCNYTLIPNGSGSENRHIPERNPFMFGPDESFNQVVEEQISCMDDSTEDEATTWQLVEQDGYTMIIKNEQGQAVCISLEDT